MTPNRARRLPRVLSREELVRLLQVAPALRDELLLGLMYATGMRVSEVVSLRWRDLDFDRRIVRVDQGKGRQDRQVMLPTSFETLLRRLSAGAAPDERVLPSREPFRHMSPRQAQRVMARPRRTAGIRKPVGCHRLRHSFATHLIESGPDIRYIQKLLGHVNLETTRLYTHVAVVGRERVESPLDSLPAPGFSASPAAATSAAPGPPPVGRMRIEMTLEGARAMVTLVLDAVPRPVRLGGIVVHEPRPQWVAIDIPPLEEWREALGRLTPQQRERVEQRSASSAVGRAAPARRHPPITGGGDAPAQ